VRLPKLVLSGSPTDFAAIVKDLKAGNNVIHQSPAATAAHGYIAPPVGPAAQMIEVLRARVESFYVTAAREYGQAAQARERTAAESRQDSMQGTSAYLNHLRRGVDAIENGAYGRVEQIVFPDDRRKWWTARAERTSDYLPSDPDAVADKQQVRAFGDGTAEGAPVGHAARLAAAKEIARLQGLTADDAQLEATVRLRAMQDAIARLPGVPLPRGLKLQALRDLAASLGGDGAGSRPGGRGRRAAAASRGPARHHAGRGRRAARERAERRDGRRAGRRGGWRGRGGRIAYAALGALRRRQCVPAGSTRTARRLRPAGRARFGVRRKLGGTTFPPPATAGAWHVAP
jgi:hypothetical protein